MYAKYMTKVIITLLLLSGFSSLFAKEIQEKHKESPVIFIHGLAAHSLIYERNDNLRSLFEKNGYPFYVAKIPAIINLDKHSKILYDEIKKIAPRGKFHLVAHSMGGIIARKVVNDYRLGRRCLSLTTISTPHRGSVIANWAMKKIEDENPTAIEKLLINLIIGDTNDAIPVLTTDYMKKVFNPAYPNLRRVKYYSMGFYIPRQAWKYTQNPLIIYANKLQRKDYNIKYNDGLVSPQSAYWGKYLGTFQGDHFAETVPIPFNGKNIYINVFKEIIKNLKRRF